MSIQDFYRNLHSIFKEKYVLSEYRKKSITQEYQLYFEIHVDSNKTGGATLEDIISKIRGINGVTIVRTSDTTKMIDKKYDSVIYIKYNPISFDKGVPLTKQYEYIRTQVERIPGVRIGNKTPAPGELVQKGDTNS
jgi:cell division protein FtsX